MKVRKILRKKMLLPMIMSIVLMFSFSLTCFAYESSPEQNEGASFYLSDEAISSFDGTIDKNDPRIVKQDILLQYYDDFSTKVRENQLGGAYFDENGNLNILVTENTIPQVARSLPIEGIKYVTAKYSYIDLQDFQKNIIGKKREIGFQASGVNQETNKETIMKGQFYSCTIKSATTAYLGISV